MALDWLGFGAKVNIEILIGDAETRRTVDLPRDNGKTEQMLVYVGEEDPVFGKVKLDLKGKQLAHQGVKLELVGQIELFYDRGNHFEFLSQEKELLPAGVLEKSQEFDFEFANAPKPHECFSGVNVRLRYFLRVTMLRQMAANLVKELDFWVYVYQSPPEVNNTIKMEVGIEDCFSEDCEILTNRGFLDLDAYKAALAADPLLRVAAFDRATQRIVYQRGELIEHARQTRTMVEFADVDSQVAAWGPDAPATQPAGTATSRGVGLLVTPGHRMLAKHANWSATGAGARRTANWSKAGEYSECEARALLNSGDKFAAVKMMALARNGHVAERADDWSCLAALGATADDAARRSAFLELYGFWLGAAGSLDAQRNVVFSHRSPADAAWLRRTLGAAGLVERVDWRESRGAIHITNAAWCDFFAAEYGHKYASQSSAASPHTPAPSHAARHAAVDAQAAASYCMPHSVREAVPVPSPKCDAVSGAAFDAQSSAAGSFVAPEAGSCKWLASWVWTRSAVSLARLFAGLRRYSAAATNDTECVATIATPSARFRDELVHVAMLAGFTAHFGCDDASGEWIVRVDSAATAGDVAEPVLYKAHQTRGECEPVRNEVREVKYSGRVWCVRVPTTFIVARRAHKDAASGVVSKASRALVVGNCLHIEFEYGKSKYHLKDVVIGKIYFLLVRIKIKHMEIALLKRESTGSGANVYNESETLTKFEIMDGAPVRGESIPVRLFLGGFDLTPTYRNVENKFSLKYYLNLVLVDEEDRRYFKQQEITLWRKVPSGMQVPTTGGDAAPLQSYSGVREQEANDEAARKEAEVRRENDARAKKKKKSKKAVAAAATTPTSTTTTTTTTATPTTTSESPAADAPAAE